MTDQQSPCAQYYNEGRTAGLEGRPSSSCPYQPNGGPNRRELLTRRMAWLEGHVDGDRERLKAIERGRVRGDVKGARRPPKPAPAPTRAIGQRRYQRRAMRSAGGPERYVERRLRQIDEENERKVTCAETET